MDWWLDMLPLAQLDEAGEVKLQYQGSSAVYEAKQLRQTDEPQEKVMLLRPRKSRIYFLRRFFNYPISLSWDTLQKLGAARVAAILFSYTQSRLFPIRHEVSLEDFFINRFGKNLYLTFFKDYTEKVWGVPCSQIPAEWGAQRKRPFGTGGYKACCQKASHLKRTIYRNRALLPAYWQFLSQLARASLEK